MGGDLLVAHVVENIGLKFQFQSQFSIHLFPAMNRFKFIFDLIVNQ